MNEANPIPPANLEQAAANHNLCSIFSGCTQGLKTKERCTQHYEIMQCPFRERMKDYLSRHQETR